MTVDSQNTEAVSSRTKPTMNYPQSFAESVLTCPKCGEAMDAMVLGMNDDGTQKVWWTCSGVKRKKCTFPLDMPQDIYWVTRSAQDIERDEVPPPNVKLLPVRYQHLYPSLFQTIRKTTTNRSRSSRQGSHESTRSISSMDSASSPGSTSVSTSVWDIDDVGKSRTAFKLDAMRKPKVVLAQNKTFIPSMTCGNRALAFAESFNKQDTTSTSLTTRLKLGRGGKKGTDESRELAKKSVIKMLSGMHAAEFKRIPQNKVAEMKRAVIEHVKKRRQEREQLAELQRLNEKRNKVVDINELVRAKLMKNKREYEQRRIAKAREAQMAARRVSRTAGLAPSAPSMPGYEEEEDDDDVEQQEPTEAATAAYATTPPYTGGAASPGPSTSSHHHEYEGFNDFDMTGLEHSDELPSSSGCEEEGSTAGSPFTELGPLHEEDLAGIEANLDFDHAFAEAFGDDFADQFADISHYN